MRKLLLILLFKLYSFILLAQTDSVSNSPIAVWGFADFYYAYDFNEPVSRNREVMPSGYSHVYSHSRHNEFALNNAVIGAKYNKDKIRGSFSLHTGTYVRANYAAEPDILRLIYDAYVGYRAGKKVWVDAGVFASHIGSETALSIDNLTLSRSIMADNTPYYESGAKVTYTPTDKLTLTGLVLNGWQNIQDNNKNKALGWQIQYKPIQNLLLNSSSFYGKEAGAYNNLSRLVSTDSLSTKRLFHDLYAQLDLNKFTIIAAFDIGFQQKRTGSGYFVWYNPNLMIRFRATERIGFTARTEYYNDQHGVIIYSGTANGFQTFTPSLNADFKLAENVMWRIEGRLFQSKDKVYFNSNGNPSSQDSFVLTSLAMKF